MGKAISVVEPESAVVQGEVSNVLLEDQVETRRVVDVGKATDSAEDAVEREQDVGGQCVKQWQDQAAHKYGRFSTVDK